MKQCSTCKIEKPLDEFYSYTTPKGELKATARCKLCHAMACRQCYKNYDWRVPLYRRLYGMTVADYDRMLASQDGGCAICGTKTRGSKPGCRLAIDHDHESGKVRGLLCGDCNTAIGKFRDDPALLEKAAKYIKQHKGVA